MSLKDSLPFGDIDDEDLADNLREPLCYAESKFKNGRLDWESSEYTKVYERSHESFHLKYGGEREEISAILAKKILKLNGFKWDYAE